MDTRKVLVPIADGIEELEAVTIIDVLRRAGADVTAASVNLRTVVAGRGLSLNADKLISECADDVFDMVVCPGGMPGAENLRDSGALTEILNNQSDSGRYYAAVCASPAVIFAHHGLLKGKTATCYPSMSKLIENYISERVVIDGNCITSQGPGTAMEFSLKLVELLFGEDKAKEIAQGLLVD